MCIRDRYRLLCNCKRNDKNQFWTRDQSAEWLTCFREKIFSCVCVFVFTSDLDLSSLCRKRFLLHNCNLSETLPFSREIKLALADNVGLIRFCLLYTSNSVDLERKVKQYSWWIANNSTKLGCKGNDLGPAYLWNIIGRNLVGFSRLQYCVLLL